MVIRNLTSIIKQHSGRNNSGKITIRHRGGRHKRLYRVIALTNRLQGVARVLRIEYDPNRTGRLALLWFPTGILCYMLCADQVCQGQKILIAGNPEERAQQFKSFKRIHAILDYQEGNVLPIRDIPLGSWIFNIGINKNERPRYGKAAGVYLKIVSKKISVTNPTKGFAGLALPSGQLLFVDLDFKATLGRVSNVDHKLIKLRTAGQNRRRGWRPSVRGVAMNPVDHPHGGGEGKTTGGRPSVSAWGRLTKGVKTRKKRKIVKFKIIARRRNKLQNFKYTKYIEREYHKRRYFLRKEPNYFKKRFHNDKIALQTNFY